MGRLSWMCRKWMRVCSASSEVMKHCVCVCVNACGGGLMDHPVSWALTEWRDCL